MYAENTISFLRKLGKLNNRQVVLTCSSLDYSKGDPIKAFKKAFGKLEVVQSQEFHKISPSISIDQVKIDGTDSEVPMQKLLETVKHSPSKKLVIFTSFISRSSDIQELLEKEGILTSILHADMEVEERSENLLDFLKGRTRVIVGTELLSRGLELDTDHVIMYNIPSNPASLLQRIGRTGRMGKFGRVTLFVRPEDEKIVKQATQSSHFLSTEAKPGRARLNLQSFLDEDK